MSRRLVGIDVLRGVAVLAVVLSHLPFSMATDGTAGDSVFPPWANVASEFGAYGVNLFLVISGFCIHRQAALGQRVSFGAFWKRRLFRLYPPYAVAATLSVLGYRAILGHWPAILDLAALTILMQNMTGAGARIGNPPFWSLALEEHLYFLYFPLRAAAKRWGWDCALAIVAGAVTTWQLSPLWLKVPPNWSSWASARWFEWALGAVAVEAYAGKIKLPPFWRSPFTFAIMLECVCALTWILHDTSIRNAVDPLWGVTFFVLVNWAWHREPIDGAWGSTLAHSLSRIGLWSYSIYLTHTPLMLAVKIALIRVGVTSVPAILLVRVGIAIGGGFVFFRLVERRFLNPARVVLIPPEELETTGEATAP